MKYLLHLIGTYFNVLSWIAPKSSAKQAFHLFGFPFKAKVLPAHQEFLDSSNAFTLIANGKKVQYYSWGNGKEKILLVHGWQSNAYRWKSYINAFDKNKCTIYAFDAPGHGNSEGRICTVQLYELAIDALIQAHGRMDHFVAHSLGCFSCASYMYHHNYAPKTFVSLASPFSVREFLKEFKGQLNLSKRSEKYLIDYFKTYANRNPEHYSLTNFTKKIQPQRTLIIHDKDDQATPQKNAVEFYNLLKNENQDAQLVLTEGLRHSLRSDKIVDIVVRYVAGQFKMISAE